MSGALAILFPHVAETDGIFVRVAVSYLPEQSAPSAGRWFWSYHVRIENQRDVAVQLLSRHWIITDGRGAVHDVQGEGVVGDTPTIQPGESYDYVSGCPLTTASGWMRGTYQLIDGKGERFDAAIPEFVLACPE